MRTTMVQERCPEGHLTKRGPYLILFHLLQLAAAWNREKKLSISESFHQYHNHVCSKSLLVLLTEQVNGILHDHLRRLVDSSE